eukprot:TRINITY_DN396_c0_g1_i1.p1 TRINITY_DN396_c0_g1~~TRINITY_DN396_c0_g1_i1.p1  ORF type:complete len:718 (+),score=222.19 TRINITY_DN396_c0_g1_i1:130-2283(+)
MMSKRTPLGQLSKSAPQSRLPQPKVHGKRTIEDLEKDVENVKDPVESRPLPPASKARKVGTAATHSSRITATTTSTTKRANTKASAAPPLSARSRTTTTATAGRTLGSSSTSARKFVRSSSSAVSSVRKMAARTPSTASKKPSQTENTASKKPKRAAWDIKGKLEDLKEIHIATKKELEAKTAEVESMREEMEAAKNERSSHMEALKIFEEKTTSLQASIEEKDEVIRKNVRDHDIQIKELKMIHSTAMSQKKERVKKLKKETTSLLSALKESEEENTRLNAKCDAQMKKMETDEVLMATSQSRISVLERNVEGLETVVKARDATIETLEKELTNARERISELERKRDEDEMTRRRLHNTIQELKGNIRVYCRVRPPLPTEPDTETKAYRFLEDTDSTEMEIVGPERESFDGERKEHKKFLFSFDRIFAPQTTQEDVFSEISQLVQSALDGYKVCIFAYGQTGSGKTYTMEGPQTDSGSDAMGMIPRSVLQIFNTAEAYKARSWDFSLTTTYLEIYNEQIRDLLASDEKSETTLDVKHDREGNVFVQDLTQWKVTEPFEVFRLLERANRNRSVAETRCNERSSRSHSVFQLRIDAVHKMTGEETHGVLNLIDLAGSERLSSSGSTGDRLKETQHINKSLSALGDVMTSLANQDKHIPYRNSKLTFLLKDFLGGNAKTLMFVNVSPIDAHLSESIRSLRFASKVNACVIGSARREVKV